MTGLGTQIVNQMVRSELQGNIEWLPGAECGTTVVIRAHLNN